MCRARGKDGTVEQRVFRALARCSMCVAWIAADIGEPHKAVQNAMKRLQRRALVGRHTITHQPPRHVVIFYAVGHDEPPDERGKSVGSRNQERYRELLHDEAYRARIREVMRKRHERRSAKVRSWTNILFGTKLPPIDASRARVHLLADD